MPTRRQQRLNDLLREELVLIVPGRLDDERLVNAIVTRVESTQDLSVAKVYVTNGGDDEDADEMLAALRHAAGYISSDLGALGLRRLPELLFVRDTAYESGERVLALIETLHEAPPAPGDPEAPGD